jgi:hypothetical protein
MPPLGIVMPPTPDSKSRIKKPAQECRHPKPFSRWRSFSGAAGRADKI